MDPFEPTAAEVDAVIAEFDGDLRAVIAALLHDLAMLAADFDRSVSRGYVRGKAVVITLPGPFDAKKVDGRQGRALAM